MAYFRLWARVSGNPAFYPLSDMGLWVMNHPIAIDRENAILVDKSRTTLLAQYRAMEKLLELAEQQVKTGQESVNILKREMGRLSKQLES